MSNLQQDINKTQAELDRGALVEGAAAVVPKGDEAAPIKVDPMAARKAMFKRADALRGLESAEGRTDADPELIARLQAEARGEDYQPDTTGNATAVARDTPPTGQDRTKYVKIAVQGGEIQVSQADIDREGGIDSYLRQRQMDEAMAQSRIEIANLQRELAESNRLREEQKQARLAGQDDPANRSAHPADRDPPGSGASEQELAGLAAQLAKQIYSGDENDAQAAILEILRRSRGETLSADDIEHRVRAAVAETTRATIPAATTVVPVNPRLQAINAQIDDMAIREYPDLCKNEIARTATFAYFKELVNLPENRDRRAVDVARDACDWGKAKFFGEPRSQIIERKRGLPSSVTASGATTTTTEDEAITPSQAVAMQQAHRNFGRRIHPQ
jgi:hypothetical protein